MAYFDIIEKEPAITADVQDVANKNGGELHGLEYRVKTPSSTYEKMHEREEGTDIGKMKDVIRYTEIYPPDKLAEGTNAWHVKMADIKHNMDISRIPEPTAKDFARIEKYKKAIAFLES